MLILVIRPSAPPHPAGGRPWRVRAGGLCVLLPGEICLGSLPSSDASASPLAISP